MSNELELIAGPNDDGRRLDRLLRKALPDLSLSAIHRLLRLGKVQVNGKPGKADERIKRDSIIRLNAIVNNWQPSVNAKDRLPLLPPILWQGSGIIILNKPSGLLTHGTHSMDTLVTAYLTGMLPPSLSFKPGPLHRLDKFTSGALAFSQNLEGAQLFSRLLREKKIEKTYLAIVEGCIFDEHEWQDKLSRNKHEKKTYVTHNKCIPNALSMVKPLACNNYYTLAEIRIITGRTHQIRAQAAAHGYPLAADTKYGGHIMRHCGIKHNNFFLHAWKLGFRKDVIDAPEDLPDQIIAPLPELFLKQISNLFTLDIQDIAH